MSVPTDVFKLLSYRPCGHELLLRVRRPGASNADQRALDAADDFADLAVGRLRTWWERWHLQSECQRPHTPVLVAEMEGEPVGDDLSGPGLRHLALWVARTRYDPPWALLGAAPTEAEFWQLVHEDPDFAGLRARIPAELHHAFLLTDEDGSQDLSGR